MQISVVEYGVQNYPVPAMAHNHETGMGGWHFMRIEYHSEDSPYAFLEHHLWTPPGVSSAVLEDFLNEQWEKYKTEVRNVD